MIDWKDSNKVLPEDGAYVAALKYHWKECWPLSAEIIFGEVESYTDDEGTRIARVNTCDFTGAGGSFWNFNTMGFNNSDCIVAWAYAKDFERPAFLNHNPHWGEEK